MPQAEAQCNCMYCQINRILRKTAFHGKEVLPDHPLVGGEEDQVTENDLHFQQWDIKLVKEKMYSVTNKLDPTEQYTVHLGEPIGCTCGKANCEHIVAVLRS